MTTHSILAPSSAGVWGKTKGCPGHVTAAQMWPDLEDTPESMEGDAAHWVGERLIKGRCPDGAGDFVDAVAPNGVVITNEMAEGAAIYAHACVSILENPMVKEFGVEDHVEIPAIHELCHGTPDFWAFSRGEGILWIVDFKFGFGYVSEYENWQLLAYMSGVLDKLGMDGSVDRHISVRLVVAQPRAYGHGGAVRQWEIMASDGRPYINIMRNAADEALGANPTYRSGPHCKHCPARGGRCEAALAGGTALYEAATNALPQEVGPVDVGTLLEIVERAAEHLKGIQAGLEAQAVAYMRGGQNVPGRVVATTYGREKWSKPASEVLALGDMFGWDFQKPLKERDEFANILTPAKIKNKFPIDSDVINAYCTRPATGSKITKDKHNQVERLFKR